MVNGLTQQIVIALDGIAIKRVQVGDIISVNINLNGSHRVINKVYRVMVVDRVNELASCVLEREVEMRV